MFEEEKQELVKLGIKEKDLTVIIDLLRVIIQTKVDEYFESLEAMND